MCQYSWCENMYACDNSLGREKVFRSRIFDFRRVPPRRLAWAAVSPTVQVL